MNRELLVRPRNELHAPATERIMRPIRIYNAAAHCSSASVGQGFVGTVGYTAQHEVAALYRHHHGWLSDWLRRRLGNTADAADLAQDAFLRLLLKPVPLRTAPQARHYLRTMANGLCVDLWRRREVEQAWLEALAAHPHASAPSAEERAIVIESLCRLGAMLARLPENVASAFVLSQLHGLRYREIAQRLQVSERSVKKYMARAMLHCLLLEASST